MKSSIALLIFVLTTGFGALISSQAAGPMDKMSGKGLTTKPSSSAFQSIEGKLVEVDGEFYILEDSSGKQRRVHVNKETVLLNGPKQPGDSIRVEVTQTGHAISIQ